MKRFIVFIALIAIAMFASVAFAQPGSVAGTLYQQEGTTADGPSPINASGRGPTGTSSDNWTNWKWQSGGGWASQVYAGSTGWLTVASGGDSNMDVEADIEMFSYTSIANSKIYFHIGNIINATNDDLKAYMTGELKSNNGQYVGISFPAGSKTLADFEKVGGAFTGKIIAGMKSDRDTWRVQNNSMDMKITMNDGVQGYLPPVNYGDGAHNTIHDTLWWLVNNGVPGSYNLTWMVDLLPSQYQPDGDYHLDPVVVTAPAL